MPSLLDRNPIGLVAAAQISANGEVVRSFGCLGAQRIDVGIYAMLIEENGGFPADQTYTLCEIRTAVPPPNALGFMMIDFTLPIKLDFPDERKPYAKGMIVYEIVGGEPTIVDRDVCMMCFRAPEVLPT